MAQFLGYLASQRHPSTGGGPGFRACGPLNQGYGVTAVVIGGKITNAWPSPLKDIISYLR
ncbi:hypothetical protein E6H27_03410 [Candidatus Bathyarchaeota archaeon]|nr:MAG: hypothetical protein E6H27_03410 [Candidatus Bathyarchaeota archaeon]